MYEEWRIGGKFADYFDDLRYRGVIHVEIVGSSVWTVQSVGDLYGFYDVTRRDVQL